MALRLADCTEGVKKESEKVPDTFSHLFKSDNSVISSFDYAYDAAGHRTRVVEADGDRGTWSLSTFPLNACCFLANCRA